jgi:hypothetical protein
VIYGKRKKQIAVIPNLLLFYSIIYLILSHLIIFFFEQNGRSSAFQLREKEIEFKVHRTKSQTAKQKREVDPGKKP